MNSMGYPQQYPGAQPPAYNMQIIRRPLTDAERQLPGNFYKTLQNSLRGLALFCLILFVFSTFVLPSMITDAIMLDSISMTLSVFMAVFGLVAIGMSVNAIVIRNRLSQAMIEGTAVEVNAPAYKSMGGKMQTWTVGPVSIMPTRGLEGLMMEGQPATVLCLPKMKAAIAINNCGLRRGARITCPPNLEAMAVPVGIQQMPMNAPIPSSAYPAFSGPAPPMQPPMVNTDDDLPPPPTD